MTLFIVKHCLPYFSNNNDINKKQTYIFVMPLALNPAHWHIIWRMGHKLVEPESQHLGGADNLWGEVCRSWRGWVDKKSVNLAPLQGVISLFCFFYSCPHEKWKIIGIFPRGRILSPRKMPVARFNFVFRNKVMGNYFKHCVYTCIYSLCGISTHFFGCWVEYNNKNILVMNDAMENHFFLALLY